MLTQDQIATIKSFPPEIVQYARKALHSFPDKKNDFQWIYESCIAECKVKNIPIDNILNKHGYNSRPKTFKERQPIKWEVSNSGYLTRQMYQHHEQTYSQLEAEDGVKKIMENTESFNKMVSLLGEDTAVLYQKKMIDNIISRIT